MSAAKIIPGNGAPMKKNRRFGRFTIPCKWIHQSQPVAQLVMSKVIVVRAQHLFELDLIEYFAYSEMFREVSEGEVTPDYVWHIDSSLNLSCKETTR